MYSPKGTIVGVNVDGSFNQSYPKLTVIQSSAPMTKQIFRLDSTRKFFKHIGVAKDELTWQDVYSFSIPTK